MYVCHNVCKLMHVCYYVLQSMTYVCQHKIKLALKLINTDLTLVEIYTVTLNFGLDTCQIKMQIVQLQVNTKSPPKMSKVRLFHALYVLCTHVYHMSLYVRTHVTMHYIYAQINYYTAYTHACTEHTLVMH